MEDHFMRYISITSPDINNGLGFRVTLWISGCKCHCEGCHNPETWNFMAGKEFDDDAMSNLLDKLSKPYIKGLTLSGGNPTDSDPKELLHIITTVKNKFPEKDIWMFSGNYLEDLKKRDDLVEVLQLIDVLVDGPFIIKNKDVHIAFRGSTNQRIWVKDPETNEFIISKLN